MDKAAGDHGSATRDQLPPLPDRRNVEIMTKASGAASRAAAARTADDLLALRAARFREREQEPRRLITDYHRATAQAQKIHHDAQARAAQMSAGAQMRIASLRERADKGQTSTRVR